MNPIVLIPARMASTRLPDKPLALIAGEPMIVHVWKRAMEANVGPVVVAYDDERIAAAITRAGGQGIMTKKEHPSGSDRIYEALQRVDPKKQYDVIINVQGDVPTIDPQLIRAVLTPLQDKAVDIATLACEIKDAGERVDTSVVKPVLSFHSQKQARALYFTRTTAPYGDGPLYHHIGIYAYRREALATFVTLPPSPLELREKLEQLRALEAGLRIDAVIVDTVPLGVDTPEHLENARKLLGRKS